MIYTYVCIHLHKKVHGRTYKKFMHACMHACLIHQYMHECIHTYTQTSIHRDLDRKIDRQTDSTPPRPRGLPELAEAWQASKTAGFMPRHEDDQYFADAAATPEAERPTKSPHCRLSLAGYVGIHRFERVLQRSDLEVH